MAARRRRAYANQTEVTPERAVLLRAIERLTRELGHAPSTIALMGATGLSRGAVRGTLARLERDGLVHDVPRTVRSGLWALTEKGEQSR